MARRAFAYRLTLSQCGPAHDPDFLHATKEVRAEVLSWLVVYGLKSKDQDLAMGLDADGNPLKPVSAKTRKYRKSAMGPADPDAPALMPAYAVSRTRLLLEGAATARGDAAEFYWGFDDHTGGSWGKILGHHRRGIGKRKVKRDVIGLSPEGVARVREWVIARWAAYKLNGMRTPNRPQAPPPETPAPRLAVNGRTDFDSFTYGIGGKAGADEMRALLAAGRTTGFRQRKPGDRGGFAFGGPNGGPTPAGPKPKPPKPPAPKPKPKPKPATPKLAPAPPPVITEPPKPVPAPPKPAPRPAGARPGSALTVEPGELAPVMRRTIDAVDSVHGAAGLQPVPVGYTAGRDVAGQYFHDETRGRAARIEISTAGEGPALTLAHEMGHYLERMIPGRSGAYTPLDSDPRFADWFRAVESSEAFRALKARRDGKNDDWYAKYFDYLADPAEAWARSYAQYVATRAGTPELKAALDADRAANIPAFGRVAKQWTDADFGPIAAAIDELFKALGWLS